MLANFDHEQVGCVSGERRSWLTEVFNDMLTGYANEANRNIPGGYTQSATGMPSGSAPDESGGLPHKDEPRIVKVRTKRG